MATVLRNENRKYGEKRDQVKKVGDKNEPHPVYSSKRSVTTTHFELEERYADFARKQFQRFNRFETLNNRQLTM